MNEFKSSKLAKIVIKMRALEKRKLKYFLF